MTKTEKHKSGFVSLVGAGPGDPGLITLRGAERLTQADMVVYDRLANPVLLGMAPQAELLSVGKRSNHHPIPQDQINSLLIENARAGKRVVRLKGGDPFVFGRGGEEALALNQAGIAFEIIPGVTSAIAVPAYAGIPLTHRNLACSAAIVTGHRAQWIENPEDDWQRCSLAADSLVFLMGVKNLPRIVEQLLIAGRPAQTPVALIEQGTLSRQKTVRGTLADIVKKAREIRPPAVIVVGEVVQLRDQLRWFDSLEQQPLLGLRVLSTKTNPPQMQNGHKVGHFQLDDFDTQIYALGGQALHMPVLQVLPPPDKLALRLAAQRLIDDEAYTWVVFTSVNGVRFIFETLTTLDVDARGLKGVKVATIGSVTAQALQDNGIRPDFVPTRFTGADLGEQLPIRKGDTILLPRSELALPELPEILERRGAIVDQIAAYATKPAPPDSRILDQLYKQQIDLVAFFSPSGVQGMANILVQAGHTTSLAETLKPLAVACIGPTTEKAARELGLQVDVVAREYTSAGLVQEITRWRKRL